MINVAIVEDEKKSAELLARYISDYVHSSGEELRVTAFGNAVDFLSNYRAEFDIVFMDIEMPGMDGMTASRKLRETDPVTVIVFVTNMAQFAVKGYEVGALDYIVKPLSYYDFRLKLQRAVNFVRSHDDKILNIVKSGGYVRVRIRDIMYVEVMGHKVAYHLNDAVIGEYRSLSSLEEVLRGSHFIRCNNYCLVNPVHITYVHGLTIRVGGEELTISHPKKKAFMQSLNRWLAEGRTK